jgi:hypothetical protein
MSKNIYRARSEQAIISEAKAFLNKMRFSEISPARLEGDHIAIFIDPQFNEDSETIKVFITCHAFGHQEADWDRYVIFIKEDAGHRYFSLLNLAGHASFRALPFGNYRMSLLELNNNCEEIGKIAQGNIKDGKLPVACRNDVMNSLQKIAIRPESSIQPALKKCLALMCDPDLDSKMRVSVSEVFKKQSAEILQELDLFPYAKMLTDKDDVIRFAPSDIELESAIYKGLGAILSPRSEALEDETAVLKALIMRTSVIEASMDPANSLRSRAAVKLRGPRRAIRTRGGISSPEIAKTARTGGGKIVNPLVALAKAGGRRIRDRLLEMLPAEPENKNLLTQLGKLSF